jgi:TPP-dependent pyruvate/acetoin dehydrogenase alpha subunit
MSDPGKYRTKEEVEEMMRHDPILLFAEVLKKEHGTDAADLEAMDKDVQAQVAEAVRFAEQSPWPPVETMYEDVYVRSPYIHHAAADRDPAWKASVDGDRVPEHFPEWKPLPAPAKVEG